MHEPRVTVAMTVQGNSPYFGESIDSILSQSMPDFELLIAADVSEAETRAIVNRYNDPRIRVIPAFGDNHAKTLNKLLAESRGRFIALADSATIMQPDRLRIQAEYLDAHPDVDGVCADAMLIDKTGSPLGILRQGCKEKEITLRMISEREAVCTQSAMIRRSSIQNSYIKCSTDCKYVPDYDFWIRFIESGNKVIWIPQQLIKLYNLNGSRPNQNTEVTKEIERLQNDLIKRTIERSNPGYKDPEIPVTGNKLTLIIIFLNEGEEVENTIHSFLSFANDKVDVIVINDGSYDGYPYMQRLAKIKGVTYILNRERIGTAGSRNKGVELSTTPYFLLLDAHMRAYNDNWVTEIPKYLEENSKRYICCQTRFLSKNENGEIVEPSGSPYTFGARMTFRSDSLVPGIQWVKEERNPYENMERIQCVLGACYAMSRDYWLHIGGMNGIRLYGCEEQFVSLKVWLNGGECLLLKDVILGHIYREVMPYSLLPETMMTNALFISESLFPLKERCKARAAAYSISREKYFSSVEYLKKELADIIRDLQRSAKFNRNLFPDIINWNRLGTKLDRNLIEDIKRRLPEIANFIVGRQPLNAGLYSGAMAFAVWLYLYHDFTGDRSVLFYAKGFLKSAIKNAETNDLSFSTGITGIGWGLKLLAQYTSIGRDVKDEIAIIDKLIVSHIKNFEIADCKDLSLSTGLTGILAYFCFSFPGLDCRDVEEKLTSIASMILQLHSSSTTDLFFAFFWMQQKLENQTGNPIKQRFLVSDWAKPSMFIPKDNRFWKISLYDGVLASSSLCFNLNNPIAIK